MGSCRRLPQDLRPRCQALGQDDVGLRLFARSVLRAESVPSGPGAFAHIVPVAHRVPFTLGIAALQTLLQENLS